MRLVVLVEVQAVDGAAHLPVLEHALGTVTERYYSDALAADGHCSCQVVHVGVGNVGRNVAVHPCVEDTRTVDAEQHAETRLVGLMVHVGNGVHARLRIAQDAVDHARRTCRRRNFSWVEHVERQRVVGLVATTIRDGRALFQTEFLGSSAADRALHTECRHDVGDDALGESIVVEQELGRTVLLEVPKHALGESADRGVHHSAQAHGQIVAGQHDFVNLLEQLGFVLFHPRQFGSGEVAGRVEQMAQALVCTQFAEGFLTVGHSARVAPDDARAEHLLVLVHADEAVHLVRNADSLDVVALGSGVCHDFPKRQLRIFPPRVGVLFCPSGLYSHDGSFFFREKSRGSTLSALHVDQRCLDRRAAHIES